MTLVVKKSSSVAYPNEPGNFVLSDEESLRVDIDILDRNLLSRKDPLGIVQVRHQNGSALNLSPGSYTLSKGWHEHSLVSWNASLVPNPQSVISYMEIIERPDTILNGCASAELIDGNAEPVFRPAVALGTLTAPVLLEAGVDDLLEVYINGKAEKEVTYGNPKILDLTQRLKDGLNSVKLEVIDNNNGRCWAIGYRIGDRQGWRYSESYGNTSCGPNLPKKKRVMYSIQMNFRLER